MTTYEIGRYRGRIVNWGLSKTKTGKDQFWCECEILGKVPLQDPDGMLEAVPTGTRTIYRVITDKTIDWVMQDLKYLGYNRSSFRYLDRNVDGAVEFEGQEVDLSCDHEEYEGDLKERWSFSYHGERQVKPLEDKEVRQLDALFGRQLKESFAETELPPPDWKDAVTTAPSDDEIPF